MDSTTGRPCVCKLCLRHGIPVWLHIGQSTIATSKQCHHMTSDVKATLNPNKQIRNKASSRIGRLRDGVSTDLDGPLHVGSFITQVQQPGYRRPHRQPLHKAHVVNQGKDVTRDEHHQ